MQRRSDRPIGLFLLGAVLLSPPLVMLPTGATVFGWPAAYVYLLAVWGVLVLLLALITRRGSGDSEEPHA